MVFHVFEISSDLAHYSGVGVSPDEIDSRFADLAEDQSSDYTYALGTVEAESIQEAVQKVREGKWEWTQAH